MFDEHTFPFAKKENHSDPCHLNHEDNHCTKTTISVIPHSIYTTSSGSQSTSTIPDSSPPILSSNPSNSPLLTTTTPSPPQTLPLNPHQMQTRAKSGIYKPKVYMAAVEPTSINEALQLEHWKSAMQDELLALQRNNTWTLVSLPPDRKVIGCKWVFKTKENPDGTVHKYKARLVAKGYHQVAGFDFTKTFSPVVKPTTIRILLAIAISRGWSIRQLDINNAFLNGDLKEEIFMEKQPGPTDSSFCLQTPQGIIWTQTGTTCLI